MASYDENKLTKLSALKALAQKVKDDYATSADLTALTGRVGAIETKGAEKNVIESVKVNGVALEVADKAVDVTVPKKVSDIENDSDFQTESEVNVLINSAINTFTKNVTENETVDTFKELVDYVATHAPEAANMASDIEKLNGLVGETGVAQQITAALASYVKKDGSKVLSTNDYSAADKAKVDAIDYATEEEVTQMLTEVFAAE